VVDGEEESSFVRSITFCGAGAGSSRTVDQKLAAVGAVVDGEEESSFVRSITFCDAGAGFFGIVGTGAIATVDDFAPVTLLVIFCEIEGINTVEIDFFTSFLFFAVSFFFASSKTEAGDSVGVCDITRFLFFAIFFFVISCGTAGGESGTFGSIKAG